MSKHVINEQVAKILAKAKVNVVNVERVLERGPKGHFKPGLNLRVEIDGSGVAYPVARNYFKRVRIPALAAVGVTANLQRVRKNTNKVVLELVAA